MYRATKDIILPTTITGSLPRPSWYTENLGRRHFIDAMVLRRFRERQRVLVESDLLILANDHWNFDVRGFNPGGNHGSFFRVSTHSTLMLAGGERTRIPRGLAVEEPYDSLSLMPTLLALTGQMEDGTRPVPVLQHKGFRDFPGRVISEIFGGDERRAPVADAGAPTPGRQTKAEGAP